MAKSSSKSTPRSVPQSRKQLRKEKRRLKKIKRNENYINRNKSDQKDFDEVVNEKYSMSAQSSRTSEDHLLSGTLEKHIKEKQKEAKNFKKLQNDMKRERKRQLMEANEEEDRVIKSLEKKLKMNKRKSKSLPQSFTAEGLDYLLEVCDFNRLKDSVNLEKELNENGTDFESDLAVAKKTNDEYYLGDNSNDVRLVNDESEFSSDSDEGNVQNFDALPRETGTKKKPLELEPSSSKTVSKKVENEQKKDRPSRLKMLQAFVDENKEQVESSSERSEFDDDQSDEDSLESEFGDTSGCRKKLQEDIYGRLRDEDGNIIKNNEGKYIPPHLRAVKQNSSNENSEVVQRLRKQMKGALNRLAESNMHSIAAQMEDIYMKHSRNDCNSVLLRLLTDSLISPVLSPERIVIEHAMLISLLHANIGSEIGAFILQNFVEEWHKIFESEDCTDDKRVDNVVLFLCQMYNFKIFHACLIYEILNKCAERFREKEVELILLVLKNVGFNLRKDDPVSLKELIFRIQKKSNESADLRENTRVRFMLDTLLAVKKNNVTKIQNYDPSYVDHLRKIQKSFLRVGKYVTELKISLEDLLNADTRGRWWIVGSAWSDSTNKSFSSQKETVESASNVFDHNVLKLAKKNRMNTDTRRNIFCILMTAEDFVDASEKLVKLGLKGQQFQEIIYVLMHCLLKEKKYNPYYAYIAEQFCSIDRKYQLAIQFCVWDKFKEINSFTSQQIVNLSKFLSYLFVELKLPLSVLKVLQFTEMNKHMVKLIRQIVLTILMADDESTVLKVFSRIAKSEKLFMLREGLQLFLHHFILKHIEKHVVDDDEKLEMLSKRVESAVTAMRGPESNF